MGSTTMEGKKRIGWKKETKQIQNNKTKLLSLLLFSISSLSSQKMYFFPIGIKTNQTRAMVYSTVCYNACNIDVCDNRQLNGYGKCNVRV